MREWADEHGHDFTDAAVQFLTAQAMATAAAMRKDPDERWRETDDDRERSDPNRPHPRDGGRVPEVQGA
ncbi:MAG: hypothetical protein ACK5OX_17995 [Desertimonas sp.]